MLRGSVVVALLIALVAGSVGCLAQDGTVHPEQIEIQFEHYSLDNGLDVILRKDDRLPVVSVNVWYDVGPANEAEGRRGFAHLFEHMMLQGSAHAPGDYISRLQAVGATGVNGNTGLDRTAYFQDVPSDQLELALWAESDRMGFLLEALTLARLRNQQNVVRNERRQLVDNSPYGLAREEVYRQLFPNSHPYHHYVLGSHLDIQSAELQEVREFFNRFYGPHNASLAIVGNLDIPQTKRLVSKYFGGLSSRTELRPVEVEVPRAARQTRVQLSDTVELPRVYMAWVVPAAFAPGDAEAALAARMLGGGKASRLYRDLVHNLQIAQSVVAEHQGLRHGSVFQITATAQPGHTAEELHRVIGQVLDRMAAEGPGEKELAAARTSTRAVIIKSLEATAGVADRLNAYNHFLGEPGYLAQDLRRFDAVTVDGVKEFVDRYLRPDRSVVVEVNPGPKSLPPDPPPPLMPPEQPLPATTAEPWRNRVPGPIQPPPAGLPAPVTFRLESGLKVFLVRRPELPLATVQLTVRSGSAQDPPGLPGLAAFTSDMLNEGAGGRGAIQIANAVTALGSTLETGSSREASWVIAQTLKSHLDETVELMSDVALKPAFPDAEVERIRRQRLASVMQQRSQPLTTAFRVMWREQYGPAHPYSHLVIGTEAGLKQVTAQDIKTFYRRSFTPHNAALILTGDLTEAEARKLAERHFGDWQGLPHSTEEPPEPSPSSDKAVVVDFPGSPQTTLVLSQPGVARTDPQYESLLIVNAVLGDLFSSRLNSRLRQEYGYTYGVDSDVTQNVLPGLVHISMSVDARHTGASAALALGEVDKLSREGITDAELSEAKRAIVRSLPGLFSTNSDIAATIAHLYALGVRQDYFAKLEGRLAALTGEQVKAAASRVLAPESSRTIAVGDSAVVTEQLEPVVGRPVVARDRNYGS